MNNQRTDTSTKPERLFEQRLEEQVRLSRSALVRAALVAVGTVSVGLGVLGVVLPILPTTPFLLLAAACFAHSSERFYVWLLTNPVFGSYIRDWRENRGLTLPVKLWVIFVLAVTMGISVVFFVPLLAVQIVLILIGLGISAYIWRLPTKPMGEE